MFATVSMGDVNSLFSLLGNNLTSFPPAVISLNTIRQGASYMLSNLFLKSSIFSVFGILTPAVSRAFLWDLRQGGSPLVILGEELFGWVLKRHRIQNSCCILMFPVLNFSEDHSLRRGCTTETSCVCHSTKTGGCY